jgi:uncharacterized protein YkwD
MTSRRFNQAILLLLLPVVSAAGVARAATPAEMISDYRLKHGEGRVKIDTTLNRIARDQAEAMAAKDTLDHSVLGSFSKRAAAAGSERAAENIAYGYDNFPKTLDQWIASSEHRRNLLMHGAERVGIASAKSSATGRMYWAMEIAGGYDKPKRGGAKSTLVAVRSDEAPKTVAAKRDSAASHACRLKIFSLCL